MPYEIVLLFRKLKILLLLIVLPLFSFPEVPIPAIALMGRLASAALVISFRSMVLLSLPVVTVVVLK